MNMARAVTVTRTAAVHLPGRPVAITWAANLPALFLARLDLPCYLNPRPNTGFLRGTCFQVWSSAACILPPLFVLIDISKGWRSQENMSTAARVHTSGLCGKIALDRLLVGFGDEYYTWRYVCSHPRPLSCHHTWDTSRPGSRASPVSPVPSHLGLIGSSSMTLLASLKKFWRPEDSRAGRAEASW